MAHIYESEVLNKLMERDGLNIPSSVPPYESEIKAYLINQVKLGYPKLTDYEAEWLLYNYIKHLPADFPIKSITNVTEATVNDVVPYAYKSAILSGSTLVNLLTQESSTNMYTTRTQIDRGYRYTQQYNASMSATRFQWDVTNNGHNRLKPNTKYYVQFTVKVNKGRDVLVSFEGGGEYTTTLVENSTTTIKCSVRCGESLKRFFVYVYPPIDESYTGDTFDILDFMTIEYQDGMENWDIPYFDGMQSVKMPVLKTTGKNLFTGSISVGGLNTTTGEELINENLLRSEFLDVLKNTTYTNNTNGDYRYFFYDENKIFIKSIKGNPFTTPNNCEYIRFHISSGEYTDQLQIEQGSVATSYEPYKSNILTTSEEVELRGIGDVKDILDLVTGEYVQRIGEVVLDGSSDEKYAINGNTASDGLTRFVINSISNRKQKGNVISNLLPTTNDSNSYGLFSDIGLNIINNCSTVDDLKIWLQQNPITIQYELETESVKTVDLSIVNENGDKIKYFMPIEGTMHISTGGTPIKPTVAMEIPVEATTQNLASFIEMEV